MRTDVRTCGVFIAVVVCASVTLSTAQSLDTLLNEAPPGPEEQVVGEEVLAEELTISEDVLPTPQPLTTEQPMASESAPNAVELPTIVETPPLAEEPVPQEPVPPAAEEAVVEAPPSAEEIHAAPPTVVPPVPLPSSVAPASRPKAPVPRHKGHFLLGDEQIAGEILSSKEDKRLLIDGDIVYARLRQGEQTEVGQVIWIYHVGPSIYDTTLRNVSINQATLIGKLRVLEVKGSVLSGQIVRAYSPVLVGDVLVK